MGSMQGNQETQLDTISHLMKQFFYTDFLVKKHEELFHTFDTVIGIMQIDQ